MSEPGTVYIIDDDPAMRDSLALLLQTAGYTVAAFAGAAAFLDTCPPETAGCLILDLNMPGIGGLALQETLAQRGIHLPAIFLTGYGTIPDAVKAMRGGAADFLTKPVQGKVLLKRVTEALAKSRQAFQQARQARLLTARLAQLTERERQIVKLLAAGRSSKEIGQALQISYRTVEVHRRHIMRKLDVNSNLEVARIVFESEHLPDSPASAP